MRIESAELARHGTAVRVRLAGGKSKLLRWIDLARVLGDPDPTASRMLDARPAGDGLEVDLSGGSTWHLAPHHLVGPGDRQIDLVVTTRGTLITCDDIACDDSGGPSTLATLEGGVVLVGGGKIRWVGASKDVNRSGYDLAAAQHIDAGTRLISPGLVDCHAHPIFAGNRADEFARRAAGQTYQEIARAGGGIVATVHATRAADFDELVEASCRRLDRALRSGTTTIEAKSGYDLTVDGELRMLAVGQAIDSLHAVDVETTLLGAHALPPERADEREGYVADCAGPMVAGAVRDELCRAIDVYCDDGAFTLDEARHILSAGRAAGLAVRGHVGQFADLGCAELVAELGGTSVDHVEQISDRGIRALAANSVVAVMLPGACVQLRMAPPPVAAMRAAGVAFAVATDMNPGSSLGETLPVQMWLATTHFGMSVEEAWLGVTRVAARVLARPDIGVLVPGATADLVIWDAEHPADIPYRYDRGATLVSQVIKAGRLVG